MKTARFTLAALVCIQLTGAYAQYSPGGGGMFGAGPKPPRLGGGMAKLFGENSAFTADLEVQNKGNAGETVTIPGRIAFKEGKSRFEMDMSKMKGGNMPPEATAGMKSMGMDRMVMISRPDKKVNYVIYPGMQAFAETAMDESQSAESGSLDKFKVDTTELGRETVDGHPCVKNKTVITDEKGEKHESIVWNATDLKNFPIKIERQEGGNAMTMLYKNVKLSAPEEKEFVAPADFTKYDNMQTMMQQQMMKQFGGGAGGFPGRQPRQK